MKLRFPDCLNLFPNKRSARKLPKFKLQPEMVDLIFYRLDALMSKEKPYLNSGYSIRRMADHISVPSYQISAYLNTELGISFNDYINKFRIEFCESLIQKGMAKNLNMRGLADACGFGNRNSFTIAFKKFTGFTPSQYNQQGKYRIITWKKWQFKVGKVNVLG